MQNFDSRPTIYTGEGDVFATREQADQAASSRPGGRVIEGDGAFVVMFPVSDEFLHAAAAAPWETVGELVTDPNGELAPVWFPA